MDLPRVSMAEERKLLYRYMRPFVLVPWFCVACSPKQKELMIIYSNQRIYFGKVDRMKIKHSSLSMLLT